MPWIASSEIWRARLNPLKSDRKSTRLNSSHLVISYAVFCLKKKQQRRQDPQLHSDNPGRLPLNASASRIADACKAWTAVSTTAAPRASNCKLTHTQCCVSV